MRQRLTVFQALRTPTTTYAERLRALTLRNGILHLEAELSWLDELEEAL